MPSSVVNDGLHVAAEQLVGSQLVQMLEGQADEVVPELTSEPSWPALRAHLLALAAVTGSIHSSTCRQPPLYDSIPPATRRPCSTGASHSPHLLTRDRSPGFPVFRMPFKIITFGAEYLAKRSQLVIGLANQVASQNSQLPLWAPPGSHPSVALLIEVAVWRAAVGVDPKTTDQPEQDSCKRRPPFGNRTSTETLPCTAIALAQT